MLSTQLEQLGLTKNESTVYLALLEEGLTNVGPIVKTTKLHRQLVYEALQKLTDKQLASFVLKNNRKYFQAASPTTFTKRLREQEDLTNTIIPELLKLQENSKESVEVKTLYGKEGFWDNIQDIIDSAARTDHTMRIIGGIEDDSFYTTLGSQYKKYLELMRLYNIQKKLITPKTFSDKFKRKFIQHKNDQIKALNDGLRSPTYTRITPEMVSIEIYAAEPIVIQIRNISIATSYLDSFALLWKKAQ